MTEHREWRIDGDGYLRTGAGTKIARRAGSQLLFFDPLTNTETPMTASDWARIFSQPVGAEGAATVVCRCGETLTLPSTEPVRCVVCGRAWQMSPLRPWSGTDVKVIPCRS